MALRWDNKYEIGHPRIDAEHRIFLGLIIDLDRACHAGDSRGRLSRIIREIAAYARFHFVSEENIMIDLAYPELESHRRQHQRLLASIDDKAHQFDHGLLDGGAIVDFTFEWFALHTTQVDKKIMAFLEHSQAV